MTDPTTVRAHREDGFTLVELLVATTAFGFVLAAALAALQSGGTSLTNSSSRVDTAQRGRVAMERVVRILRSTVCAPDGTPAFTAATPTSFTAYVDQSGGTEDTADTRRAGRVRPPVRTAVTLSTSGSTAGQLTERTERGVYASATTSAVTYESPKTTVLSTDVRAVPGTPPFAYAVYDAAGTSEVTPLTATDPGEGDRTRIVRTSAAFAVASTIGPESARATPVELREDVTVGAIDLNEELPVPACSE